VVTVNGAPVTPSGNSYTISNVQANATIHVTFAKIPYTITPTADTGGSISPNVPTTVNCGENQLFTFTPDEGYQIKTVLIDGVNNPGAVASGSYTFEDVSDDHTISVTFVELSPITYTITASSGENGTITPNGTITVNQGDDQEFTFTPNNGFQIAQVLIDGVNNPSAVASGSYTFEDVNDDHTIGVTFVELSPTTYTITASSDENGTITPNGTITVNQGNDQEFTFTPNNGYQIAQVLIDGNNEPQAIVNGYYTFENITEDHTITVTFELLNSIEQIENQQIKIFPNPTNGQLIIENGELKIENVEIFDVMGRMCHVETWHAASLQPQRLNLSHLPIGIYFVRIQTKESVVIRKVVKAE
jgi:uncharacterized protein (DUF2141 family)